MYLENFLNQFWRCVEVTSTGIDEEARQAFHFDEKCCGKNLILSGLHMQHDEFVPGTPGYISFYVWNIGGEELEMDYYQTGYLKELRPIKNGFVIVTGADEEGSTTYTFKKTKINPFTTFEKKKIRKRIADIENGTSKLEERELIEEEEQNNSEPTEIEELRKEIAELKTKLEEAQQTADNYWKHIVWMRTSEDMKPKAAPCPICGSEHVGLEGSVCCREFFVWCLDCDAMGPPKNSERAAIHAWNKGDGVTRDDEDETEQDDERE